MQRAGPVLLVGDSDPASHGERVVVRLLDKSARWHTLTQLGI
jgi:type II secretory ATPase GspE/PulE/Tfp pilus assembly ATPase PilB-like protein